MEPDRQLLLTVEQAAARLGIGRTTAFSLIRSGALVSVRIGRRRLVHINAITQLIDQLGGIDPATGRPPGSGRDGRR